MNPYMNQGNPNNPYLQNAYGQQQNFMANLPPEMQSAVGGFSPQKMDGNASNASASPQQQQQPQFDPQNNAALVANMIAKRQMYGGNPQPQQQQQSFSPVTSNPSITGAPAAISMGMNSPQQRQQSPMLSNPQQQMLQQQMLQQQQQQQPFRQPQQAWGNKPTTPQQAMGMQQRMDDQQRQQFNIMQQQQMLRKQQQFQQQQQQQHQHQPPMMATVSSNSLSPHTETSISAVAAGPSNVDINELKRSPTSMIPSSTNIASTTDADVNTKRVEIVSETL